jgi:fructose-bisphosphate aldolase class I
MNKEFLGQTAQALVANNKGILAADESTGTIKKRFDKIGIESTEETRRQYRELLFTSPGIGKYISGVILYDETLRQTTAAGVSFAKVLKDEGVIPGIKVDLGTESAPTSPNELLTKGLEGLADRLKEYYALGARFAKWRAVITIGEGLPTSDVVRENAKRLAEYAKLCQEADIVPIVEPEVLMDGNHSQGRCFEVTAEAHKALFEELQNAQVYLPGILLKPNMIVPGEKSGEKVVSELIAQKTIQELKECVPDTVPGIVFLSGGQSEIEATVNLNVMNLKKDLPWKLSFSYGRALQASALNAWSGKSENIAAAQDEFLKRARLNSLACSGEYQSE